MAITRRCLVRSALMLLLSSWTLVVAQTRVNGDVAACAQIAPADVVAEARAGLAWFPVEVGRGTVGANGTFALTFHEDPYLPIEVTVPVGHLFDVERCDGIVLSDPEARIVMVRELRIIPRGAACEYCETLGTLYAATKERGSLSTTGDVEVRWVYADRATHVEGACAYGWGEETYDLMLEPGWNTLVFETVNVHPSEGFCDCRDVTVAVAPFPRTVAAWHYVASR